MDKAYTLLFVSILGLGTLSLSGCSDPTHSRDVSAEDVQTGVKNRVEAIRNDPDLSEEYKAKMIKRIEDSAAPAQTSGQR